LFKVYNLALKTDDPAIKVIADGQNGSAK
jgi:hypothetical protein